MPRVDRDGVSLFYEYDMAEPDEDTTTSRAEITPLTNEEEKEPDDRSNGDSGAERERPVDPFSDDAAASETPGRDGNWRHRLHGNRTAPVVVLQDCGYGRWMWRWQRVGLTNAGYDVIAPDLRGTGRSDAGFPTGIEPLPTPIRSRLHRTIAGYSIDTFVDDLEAILADVGTRSVHLVGAGLGGMIAQQYAITHSRVATLSLVGTSRGGREAIPIPPDTLEAFGSAARSNDRPDRTGARTLLWPAFTERFRNRNPHLLDRIVEWQCAYGADTFTQLAQRRALRQFDASDDLSQIRVPTAVLHGTNDQVVPVENAHLLEANIPDCRLEHIDGGPHLCPVENATAVTEALRSFFDTENR